MEDNTEELARQLKEKGLTCAKLDSLIENKRNDSKTFRQVGFENLAKREEQSAEEIKNLKVRVCRKI